MIRTPPPPIPIDPGALAAHHRAEMRKSLEGAVAAIGCGHRDLAQAYCDRRRMHGVFLKAMTAAAPVPA